MLQIGYEETNPRLATWMTRRSERASTWLRKNLDKAFDDAAHWLCKNNPNPDDPDDPTLRELSRFPGVSTPRILSLEEKQKIVESALEWVRRNDPKQT